MERQIDDSKQYVDQDSKCVTINDGDRLLPNAGITVNISTILTCRDRTQWNESGSTQETLTLQRWNVTGNCGKYNRLDGWQSKITSLFFPNQRNFEFFGF